MNRKRSTLAGLVAALLILASTAVAEGALAKEHAEDTMTIGTESSALMTAWLPRAER